MFLLSAIAKIPAPTAFGEAIARYDLIPPGPSALLGHYLPWLELAIGLALIGNRGRRAAWLLALTLALAFWIFVVSSWIRGLDLSCGCFATARTINGTTV